MSDKDPVIVNGIGSPRAWLFTNDGEPLRDFDEQAIAKFLTKFSYTYNEEEDDECSMTFMFPTLRSFDLPYFQQDVILNVEWGYIANGGKFIKSPRRQIAIRDLETSYKKDGIELVLKCTDLVSYIKGMKTQVVKQYRTEQTSPGTPASMVAGNKLSYDLQEEFLNNYLGLNNTSVVKKEGDLVTMFTPQGGVRKTHTKNKGGYAFNQASMKENLQYIHSKNVINNGNASIVKAISRVLAHNNTMDRINNQQGGIGKLSSSDGPLIADSTDNRLEVKTRDFNQPIFKQYTYYGGSGELLDFKSNTETRKNREHKNVSSNIDPYSKKIVKHEVDTTDTRNPQVTPKQKTPTTVKEALAQSLKGKNGSTSGKYPEQVLQQVFQDQKNTYLYGVNAVDPNVKAPSTYTVTTVKRSNETPYMGYKIPDRVVKNRVSAAEIIASPEFKDYANRQRNPRIADAYRAATGPTYRKVLTGYSIESIQRKYTGSAEVIGDPSLIKGKIYYFNNLGRLDKGKWYATSVTHEIDTNSGYICKMELMKNPATIGISAKTYSANPKYDRKKDEISLQDIQHDISENVIYAPEDEEDNLTINNMDNIEGESKFREEGVIEGMDKRLNFLKAEDDILRDLEKQPFENVQEEFISNAKSEPNSDNY